MNDLFGGIETGGTKVNCVIADAEANILNETRIPTTDPVTTLNKVICYFKDFTASTGIKLKGYGIGSFGPLDLNPASPKYGNISSTPKPGWSNTDLLSILGEELKTPIALDTDVNAAAVGEMTWGAARNQSDILYITIGTGIGGGVICDGKPLHGLVHPEVGHAYIYRNQDNDTFPGVCPFHGDCFEGLASGPAIQARWGKPPEILPPDHPAWKAEALTISRALQALILILSPQRIILGGGVMQQLHLFDLIRPEVQRLLNGYVHSPAIMSYINDYIVPPRLGKRAGVLGAVALAIRLLE